MTIAARPKQQSAGSWRGRPRSWDGDRKVQRGLAVSASAARLCGHPSTEWRHPVTKAARVCLYASESFLTGSAVDRAIEGDLTLSSAETDVNENVGSTADQFGTNVATLTTQPSESAIAAEVMRDCVKEAASDAAWDVWWGYYHQESVDVSVVLTNAAAGCLHTYTQAAWPQSNALAQTLTYDLDQSVGAVIRYRADAATVSNWLQAVSDSIPS